MSVLQGKQDGNQSQRLHPNCSPTNEGWRGQLGKAIRFTGHVTTTALTHGSAARRQLSTRLRSASIRARFSTSPASDSMALAARSGTGSIATGHYLGAALAMCMCTACAHPVCWQHCTASANHRQPGGTQQQHASWHANRRHMLDKHCAPTLAPQR